MNTAIIQTSEVQQFSQLVSAGVDAWNKAGKLLVQMVDRNPNAFSIICRSDPRISIDMLLAFERIGRNQLNPYLLLDSSPGSDKLMTLPVELQNRFYTEKIPTVTRFKSGSPIIEEKLFREMSRLEAMRVFAPGGIRTIDEQCELIAPNKKQAVTIREPARTENKFISCGFYKLVLDANGMPALVKTEPPKNDYTAILITITGDSRIGYESKVFSVGLRSEPFEVVMPAEAKKTIDQPLSGSPQTKEQKLELESDGYRSEIEQTERAISQLDIKSPLIRRLRKKITALQDKIVRCEMLLETRNVESP